MILPALDSKQVYKFFLLNALVLVLIGLVMVYSASYIHAKEMFNNSGYFVYKQIVFVVMAIALAIIVGRTKFSFWLKHAANINLIFTALVFLTFVPGLGPNIKGAHRWLNLGFINLQPGEFIKYTIILNSLILFENFESFEMKERLKYVFSLALPLGLLAMQPDFGTFSICFFVILFVCFVSSFPRHYFYTIMFSGMTLVTILMFMKPYRVKRLLSYLDPWKNVKTTGFQVIQSYLAFANGSFFGAGLGNSTAKLFYLPEAHNDFIFSVIGEELGFVGVVLMALLFVSFLYLGFKLAIELYSRKSMIAVSAITFAISLQAALNMAVVLGLLPTKGLNLPFISYGGSAMLATFFGLGLIMSAYRAQKTA